MSQHEGQGTRVAASRFSPWQPQDPPQFRCVATPGYYTDRREALPERASSSRNGKRPGPRRAAAGDVHRDGAAGIHLARAETLGLATRHAQGYLTPPPVGVVVPAAWSFASGSLRTGGVISMA